MESKYHELYLILKNSDDYLPLEDKQHILDKIKTLYKDHENLLLSLDPKGDSGILCEFLNPDSKFIDKRIFFFHTKKRRDLIFDRINSGLNWDKEFDQEFSYAISGSQLISWKKISKGNGY